MTWVATIMVSHILNIKSSPICFLKEKKREQGKHTSSNVRTTKFSSPSNIITGTSNPQNSRILPKISNHSFFTSSLQTHNCLHIPQGLAGGHTSVATATALNALTPPSVTAFPKATRSAHVPTGYDAFSTLAPVVMESSAPRTAAPTRNLL